MPLVPNEIGEQILDDDLAAEALAKERHVRADDRSEVHQDGGLARRQASQKFSECLGWKNLTFVGKRGGPWRSRPFVATFTVFPEQRS